MKICKIILVLIVMFALCGCDDSKKDESPIDTEAVTEFKENLQEATE